MAILEHETIYLVTTKDFMNTFLLEMAQEGEQLKFFNVTNKTGSCVLSGSFRSFYDLFNKKYITRTIE